MREYLWPGNVRELRNAVEFAVNSMEDSVIEPRHLPYRMRYKAESAGEEPVRPLAEVLRKAEKDQIARALSAFGSDLAGKKKAAEALGISLASLYNKMR